MSTYRIHLAIRFSHVVGIRRVFVLPCFFYTHTIYEGDMRDGDRFPFYELLRIV